MGNPSRSPPRGHGSRLSAEDYERRLVALYAGMPPAPSRAENERLQRAELDLAIEHRLGRDFPPERRLALWDAQQRVNRRIGRLILRYVARRILPGALRRGAAQAAEYQVSEYSKVLNEEELRWFFGDAEAQHPRLPYASSG